MEEGGWGYTPTAPSSARALVGGGGAWLIEYVRKDLIWNPFEDTINLNSEIILSEVNIKNNKWAIFSVYRPPSNWNIEAFLGDLWSILNKYLSKYDKVIIMGDFDIDVKNKVNPNFNKFSEFCDTFN